MKLGSIILHSSYGVSRRRIRRPHANRLRNGSLHESFIHECLKSSLAFRKPAVAAASRRPARADGPKVGLDGPASLGAGGRGASSVARSGLGAGRWALGRLGYLSGSAPKRRNGKVCRAE